MYVLLFEILIKDLDIILIIMYQELEFYKQYHSNTINRIIHFFCIPMIIVSIIIFFNNFYISYNKKNKVIYKVKFSDFIISLYTLSYLSISTNIGITMLFYFIFLRYVAPSFACSLSADARGIALSLAALSFFTTSASNF